MTETRLPPLFVVLSSAAAPLSARIAADVNRHVHPAKGAWMFIPYAGNNRPAIRACPVGGQSYPVMSYQSRSINLVPQDGQYVVPPSRSDTLPVYT